MTTTNQNQSYQPNGDDLLIFEWVKMQGKSQSEVASMFGINQSTVSRIIQRVERWQAHAKARENGRLDRSERLRAQRWLTYERNELILASCLRIAKEMEGFTELSKSVISWPAHDPTEKRQIRTEGRTIDRHGVAARFLRLAWRINMEQLKLAELVDPPAAEPLTDEELAEEIHQAALDAAELAAARRSAEESVGWDKAAPAADGPPADSPPMHSVHNLHNESASEIAATPPAPCTCLPQAGADKNSPCTCITNVGRSGPNRPEAEADSQSQFIDTAIAPPNPAVA